MAAFLPRNVNRWGPLQALARDPPAGARCAYQTTEKSCGLGSAGEPSDEGQLSREAARREQDLPTVGGSDAHYPPEVGRAFTRVDTNRLTPAAVVEAHVSD
jgi:hypothetical protein